MHVSGNKYLKIQLLLHNHPTSEKGCLIFRYFTPDIYKYFIKGVKRLKEILRRIGRKGDNMG